jgi:hypothetical protein
MGMLIDDEEILLDKSWVAYIPAGVPHMPVKVSGGRVTAKPVCHWTSGPGSYTREKDSHTEDKEREKEPPKPIRKTGVMKNAKYIVFGNKPGVKRPAYMRQLDSKYTRPVAYIDETVIPGAEFGCDTMWLLPGEKSRSGRVIMDAHTLPHGTSITMTAMNYEDITSLCAEAELWIGGEKHIIDKSFGAYIPPGIEQGPLVVRNISKQIYLMISHPVGEGIKKYPGR